MRGVLLVLAALAAAAAGARADGRRTRWHELAGYTFEDYEAEFGRVYADAGERALRRATVEAELARVRRHNADGGKTWKEGVNALTDRTPAERQALRGYDKDIGFRRSLARAPQVAGGHGGRGAGERAC
jgi:hypothetical protein